MHHAKLGLLAILFGLLLMGCTAPDGSANAGTGSNNTGTNGMQGPIGATSQGTITGILDSNENFSAVMRYDPNNRQSIIVATQYMEADETEQLNFSCALGSAFLLLINNPAIYGESGVVNGSYQIRLPTAKHDQYIQGSGLTAEQFAKMNITSVAINFVDRSKNATISRCELIYGQDPTLDGQVLEVHQAPSATPGATAELIVETE